VCLDRQSIHLAPRSYEHRHLDRGKLVNGHKHQIVTDVQGHILGVVKRTFAWFTGFRRLAIDYEYYPELALNLVAIRQHDNVPQTIRDSLNF
jgi:hypothetical protein